MILDFSLATPFTAYDHYRRYLIFTPKEKNKVGKSDLGVYRVRIILQDTNQFMMRSVYYININVVPPKEDGKAPDGKEDTRDRRDRMAKINHILRKNRVS